MVVVASSIAAYTRQSRPDFRSTEARQSVSHRRSPYSRFLRVRDERPRCGGAADKCDKFPSPHGFARAEDYIGYQKDITFWIENCAIRSTQAGCA